MYDCALNKQVLLTSAGLCLCLWADRAASTWKEPELLRDDARVTRLGHHTSLYDSYPGSMAASSGISLLPKSFPGPNSSGEWVEGREGLLTVASWFGEAGSNSASFLCGKRVPPQGPMTQWQPWPEC